MSENDIHWTQKPTNSNETLRQPPSNTAQRNSAAGLSESIERIDENVPLVEATMPKTPESRAKRAAAVEAIPNLSPKRRDLSRINGMEYLFDQGYDSDGEHAPCFNIETVEGEQDFEENSVRTGLEGDGLPSTITEDDSVLPTPTEEVTHHEDISDDLMATFTNNKLKEELKKRGCPVCGKKAALLERLKNALAQKVPVGAPTKKSNKDKNSTELHECFAKGAYWEPLKPLDEVVVEPENPTFKKAHAPTIDKEDAHFVCSKHNFAEQFDREPFCGTSDEMQLKKQRGKKDTYSIKLDSNGQPMLNRVIRKKGSVSPFAMKEYKLTPQTQPEQYISIFLPHKNNPHSTKNKELLSFSLLARWTNWKAMLAGAGDTCYPDWKDFTATELRQHIGLYLLHGLSPSPRVEWKLKPQSSDKTHGNDFVHRSFGPNAERRHKHFKAFFACQDPSIAIPDRDKYPNWKVRPLLTWMSFIFPLVWMLGVAISVDEMTMRFQGKHKDKKRITYKNEGDGFQCDALCDDGYCHAFYFRNEPAPKKYTSYGMSPLHARTMALFDTLKDKCHQCAMDNLYNSATFCKRAYNHVNKVLCHGVTRKAMRGLPMHVLQEEAKTRAKQNEVRGTVKAAVLKNDPDCPDLIASSVYDSKPVHYLSMVATDIRWVEVEKTVYNVDTGRSEKLRFLRMNNINTYNHTMGDVDRADQLRGVYRFDTWVRNRKWWWSIVFWALGTMVVNAYIIYLRVNLANGIPFKDLLSHHDFQERIAHVWIAGLDDRKEPSLNSSNKRKRKRGSPASSSMPSSALFPSPCSTLTVDSKSMSTSLVSSPDVRARRVTDQLMSETGGLSFRVDNHLDHLPGVSKIRSYCALHNW
eukprot:CAMPEP_0194238244 /NCGR_PEP_ID=MMETSP0158-20130606/5025_1 /TAXON_ID=33649 /ORGANISM="Thalassionema nitzschioides, Strain L26-B" /LENGTH=863 /DNA_ID=CAMNT_0038972445 /DNA_START=101 /DNA_END=2689 /DNA_ORIENTATION=-